MSTDKPPQNDAELKTALEALFKDWRKALEAKFGEDFKDNKFVEDGAFPGYFNQKFKILFVGREAYGCEGLWDVWKHKKGCPCKYKDNPSFKCEERKFMQYFLLDRDAYKDSNHPKRPPIARLAAKVAYGMIQKQIPEWQKIPDYPAGVSFAFMDVSKFVNNKGSGLSPYFRGYVDGSLGMGKYSSSKNFIREEIELLNPDLIISWNLRAEKLRVKRFNKLLTGNHKQNPEKIENLPGGVLPGRAWTYTFDDGRKIPLFDTYHFSISIDSRSKKDPQEDIYKPVMRAFSSDVVQKLIAEKKAQDKKKG